MRQYFALLCLLIAPLAASAQANDAFNSATTISLDGGSLSGTTVDATAQAGEEGISGFAYGKSVWFRFTTIERTRFNAKTEGSSFDTTLALYRGANVSETRLIAGNDDSTAAVRWSEIDVTVPPGSYWLAIDGFNGTSGSYSLGWQTLRSVVAILVPSNDNFAAATTLTLGENGATALVNNSVATLESGEPSVGTRSVWHKFTAARTQSMRARVIDSQFDSQIDVYTGTTLGSLTSVASNDDIDFVGGDLESEVGFNVNQGTQYFVRVAGRDNGHGGAKLVVAPAKATALSGLDAAYGGTWWNPVRDGEGVLIDIADHPDPASQELFLFFTWYTYDPNGNPVYLAGGVPRSAITAATGDITIPVVTTRGGRFGAAFNAAAVVRDPWGSVTLNYRNCGRLDLTYTPTVTGWGAPSTIRLERTLARAPGLTCP